VEEKGAKWGQVENPDGSWQGPVHPEQPVSAGQWKKVRGRVPR